MSVLKLFTRLRKCKNLFENGMQSSLLYDYNLGVPHLNTFNNKFSRHFCSDFKDDIDNKEPKRKHIRGDGKVVKKIGPSGAKIVLLQDDKRVTMYLSEAQKLAKHNNFDLINVGTDHDKLVYELKKSGTLLKIDTGEKMKQYVIKTETTDHDLGHKIKQITKKLSKGSKVIISIQRASRSDPGKLEEVFQKIKNLLPAGSDVKIQKKQSSMLNFFVVSPKTSEEEKESSSSKKTDQRQSNEEVMHGKMPSSETERVMFQNPKLMVENDQIEEDRRRARENTLQNLAGYILVIGVINLIGYCMQENRTPLF